LKMDSNSLSKLNEKTENEIFKALQKKYHWVHIKQ